MCIITIEALGGNAPHAALENYFVVVAVISRGYHQGRYRSLVLLRHSALEGQVTGAYRVSSMT
jgi:hypothetical protein